MKNIAIVTGVTGQDGSYLSELLLQKDYKVYGLIRRSSSDTTERLSDIKQNKNFKLIEGDITDNISINNIISAIKPDEFYNLAAQSHVGSSFVQPQLTFNVNTIGVLNCLEAIIKFSQKTKFYQASTSEMFGNNYSNISINGNVKKIQDERVEFNPCSPYGVSKVAAHYLVQNYRKAYNLHASCGILFNHESPRRGEKFVTRKITKYVARLYNSRLYNLEFKDKLVLGNLNAKRDWGYAPDYVNAMWLMLQNKYPDDYVIATGETHSIKEFLTEAFNYIGIDDWINYVEIDSSFYRPTEVEHLCGDSFKALNNLKWKPSVTFSELVQIMLRHDIFLDNWLQTLEEHKVGIHAS